MIVFPGLPAARWPSAERLDPLPGLEPDMPDPLSAPEVLDPLDALARLAQRLFPGAIVALHHDGMPSGPRLWPDGIMGRRGSLRELARTLCPVVATGPALYVANLQQHPVFSALDAVRQAGPLGFAAVPVPAGARDAVLALFRHAEEWQADERELLTDLAASFAMWYHRPEDGGATRPGGASADPDGCAASDVAWRSPPESGTLDSILSGVGHDLNNPLTSIKSFTELLLLDARAPEDREALEIVRREAERAIGIVAGLRRWRQAR